MLVFLYEDGTKAVVMADSKTERLDGAEGQDASDVEVLRSGREEAQVVLDHQLQLLAETHKKAMWTVRITGIVFGLVLSSATLPNASQFTNGFTISGLGCLVLAFLFGVVTYSASDPEFGVGPEYLLDARAESYTESEWFDVLLNGYRNWIERMKRLNANNSKLLTVTQLFLGFGIVLLVTGIAVGEFVS